MKSAATGNRLRAGMIGAGMIFEETYWPFFCQASRHPLLVNRHTGPVEIELAALISRTGTRAVRYQAEASSLGMTAPSSWTGTDGLAEAMAHRDIQVLCVATPDDRHFEAARQGLQAGKHVLIEKPSVLSLSELDELRDLAREKKVLCRVVYHKLADPDHKKLRTHVHDGVLKHVNNGYCSLLEPKEISQGQFAEWIVGRNPGTYVAVHYIKLIDFSFGLKEPWHLDRITATGQRGIVGTATGKTWDSTQLQMTYRYEDDREASFDIHTSWVNPNNFPGYVEQEVQFRFDNGCWTAHQRKRGVEVTVEDLSPSRIKYTPNHHYNGDFLEPWGERARRGYGLEIIEQFFREVAHVEFAGPPQVRDRRLSEMRSRAYSDIEADRNTVAVVQSLEAILSRHQAGQPGGMVRVNSKDGGLVLHLPGDSKPEILYHPRV